MNAARKKPAIIVIVLIAALVLIAIVAVPAWRNHQIRGHIAEALKVADTAKLVVMESATVHGGLAHIDASDLAYNVKATASEYISQIAIGADGRISVATKNTGAAPDPALLLTPAERAAEKGTAPIEWQCQLVTGDPDQVPEECRTVAPTTTIPNPPAKAASIPGAVSPRSP